MKIKRTSYIKHFCIFFILFLAVIAGVAGFFLYPHRIEPHIVNLNMPAFHGRIYGISFFLILSAGYWSFYTTRLITKRKNIEISAREKETKYRMLYNSFSDGVVIANNEGVITDFNGSIQEIFGYKKDDFLGKYLLDLLFKHINVQYREKDPFSLLPSENPIETEAIRKNGEIFPIELTIRSFRMNGQGYYVCTFRDITLRKRYEEKIRNLSHAVEQSPNSIIITNVNGIIEYVNAKFTEQTGYTKDEAIGKTPRILKSNKMHDEVYKDLWETILSGREWRGELVNKKKNNELYWERASISHVKDNNGIITHFIAIKEDHTERKKNEEQLIYLAEHDSLTGLINRRSFSIELGKRLAESDRYGIKGAILYIDLDKFKSINDTHGHHAGDAFLIKIATLLKERLRETDTASRLGGDEFAVILHRVNAEQTRKIAEEILSRITQCVNDDELLKLLDIAASIGIALYPEHAKTAEELLNKADFAMYKAKADSDNAIRFFSGEDKYEKTMLVNTRSRLKKALLYSTGS